MPMTWCYQVESSDGSPTNYCWPGFPIGCYVTEKGIQKDACVTQVGFGLNGLYTKVFQRCKGYGFH